jgi:hypothetical protein
MRPDRARITARARDANRARARRHRAARWSRSSRPTAAIQNPTGAITVYRGFNKSALGPVGDCLDGLEPPFGGNAA